MPPVRWKLLIFGTTIWLAGVTMGPQSTTYGQQQTISMSSDGWRPIIGTGRRSTTSTVTTISPTSSVKPSTSSKAPHTIVYKQSSLQPPVAINSIYQKQGSKVPFHSKPPSPYMTAPSGPHGPLQQQPQRTSNGQHQHQIVRKHQPTLNKPKRKIIRGQALAYSQRDEVFLPPPSNPGFSFVKSISPQVKTREAQGVATFLGTNHFSISQPNSHFEFTNRFALPDDNIFNRPVPTFIFPAKQTSDDFTRNLVPPPRNRFQQVHQEQEKPRIKTTQKVVQENVVPVTEPLLKLDQFTTKSAIRTAALENVPVQVPPPFEQSFSFGPQKIQDQPAGGAVQVTKEKIQHIPGGPGTIQQSFSNPSFDYFDFNFHTVPRPSNLPKTQTYEVTEGKWLDNPNPFQFNQALIIPQKIRKVPQQQQQQQQQQAAPQQFLFQQEQRPAAPISPHIPQFDDGSLRPPPVFQSSPLVELGVPAFLPTPYRPESVAPTIPTQGDVSTVFAKVSQKMNQYKNEELTTNPFFFDVKEVSTHFPILGKPEPKPIQTDAPHLTHEDISNDITTVTTKELLKEEIPTLMPTVETTTKDVTKPRRRRPRPRRPPTTTTEPPQPTVTEEIPVVTEISQSQRVVVQEEPMVERPTPGSRIRQRQRPNRYRQKESDDNNNNEERNKEESTRVSSSNGNGERGRQRYRNRNTYNTNLYNKERNNEIRNPVKRKRLRTTSTEAPVVEDDMMSFEELTKVDVQPMEILLNENSREPEPVTTNEELNVRQNRYETEQPTQNVVFDQTTQQIEISEVTTVVPKEIVEPVEIFKAVPMTEVPVTSNIENEIDYTTHTPPPEGDSDENRRYTVGTVPPTTTTEQSTTTKSHRIRGRPLKFDSSSKRPKFSVKDYRQKLSQQSSTTSTTTEGYKTSSESLRLRFPNRLRTRPTSSSTTTTTTEAHQIEDTEEPHRYRSRYRSKDYSKPNSDQIDEKPEKIKTVTSRIRPFGRQRTSTTTESPELSPKVSIRPFNFSSRRRPHVPSLRERINKYRQNNSTSNVETTTETDIASTNIMTTNNIESATEVIGLSIKEPTTEPPQITDDDINRSDNIEEESNTQQEQVRNDALEYSQRVSDLTSSFKDQYDQPGLFSSVSATSRRIPSHFTISTDEPILPIEAFFPDIKSNKKHMKNAEQKEEAEDNEKEEKK